MFTLVTLVTLVTLACQIMPRRLFGKTVIVQLHLVMAVKAVGGQLLLQVCDGGNHTVHLLKEAKRRILNDLNAFDIFVRIQRLCTCL